MMEALLSFLLNIALAGGIAGAIAVAIKRLFPKRGDWLPVLVSAFVPPVLIATLAVYRSLVALGLMAEQRGAAPPDPISFLLDSASIYVVFSVTWLIVGVPAAFAALHLFRRK